ncbi:MAG: hypothetical protein OHK0046_11910 [Anaerolineae bacterium]
MAAKTIPNTQQLTIMRTPSRLRGRALELTLITVVLLLAAAFRFINIAEQSIWFDEAFAWNIVIQPDMFPRIAADTHPPLYYLLLRGWIGLAGDSALALRYLSALISLGTVAFTYQVGRELLRHHPQRDLLYTAPLLAALMLALTDAEIFLAQEARNYALYSFFGAVSMWLYLVWMRRRREQRPAHIIGVLWALSNAALAYTHYQGLFIPAIQGLHALLFLRGRGRVEAVGWLALSGLLFAPWFVGVTIPQAQNAITRSLPFSIPTNLDSLLLLRDNFLGAQWALLLVLMGLGAVVLVRHRTTSSQPPPPAGEALSSRRDVSHPHMGKARVGLNHVLASLGNYADAFLIATWVLIPFGVLFFGNLFADLLTERKLLIITPALAVLIGFGLARLNFTARGLLVAAILIYGVTTVDFWREKEDWARISGEMVPYVQSDDLVMAEIGVGQYPLKYYWSRTLPADTYLATFPFLGDPTMAVTTDWPTYYDAFLPQLLQTVRDEQPLATAWLVYWSAVRQPIDRLEEAGFQRTMTIPYDLGENTIYTYRYDHLPAETLTTFEPGLVLRAARFDVENLRADVWWSADAALTADYTTSVLLLDANGQVAAQYDSMPFYNTRPTSQWQAGDIVYDPKPLQPTNGSLPAGEYTAVVQVYQWTPDGILNVNAGDGERWFIIDTVQIGAA